MKSNKKHLIMQTAIKLFYKNGFSATTTAEIAAEAGIAEVTLFRHFKTKKQLLFNILEQFIELLGQEIVINPISEIIDTNNSGSAKDIIISLLKDRIELIEKNYDVLWIVLTEMRHHPELKQKFLSSTAEEGLGLIKKIVEYGKEGGELKNIDSDAIIRSFFGTVISIIISKRVLTDILGSCDDTSSYFENAVEILMHGIASE